MGNGEWGTGNGWERGTGNGERGTGERERLGAKAPNHRIKHFADTSNLLLCFITDGYIFESLRKFELCLYFKKRTSCYR